jgi:hypothetical protein
VNYHPLERIVAFLGGFLVCWLAVLMFDSDSTVVALAGVPVLLVAGYLVWEAVTE